MLNIKPALLALADREDRFFATIETRIKTAKAAIYKRFGVRKVFIKWG